MALVVANYIRGKDDRTIMFKRNIVRYMCLLQAMVYRAISPPVKRKYPTLQSLCNAGKYLAIFRLHLFDAIIHQCSNFLHFKLSNLEHISIHLKITQRWAHFVLSEIYWKTFHFYKKIVILYVNLAPLPSPLFWKSAGSFTKYPWSYYQTAERSIWKFTRFQSRYKIKWNWAKNRKT